MMRLTLFYPALLVTFFSYVPNLAAATNLPLADLNAGVRAAFCRQIGLVDASDCYKYHDTELSTTATRYDWDEFSNQEMIMKLESAFQTSIDFDLMSRFQGDPSRYLSWRDFLQNLLDRGLVVEAVLLPQVRSWR